MSVRDLSGNWSRSEEEKAFCFANHLEKVFQPNCLKDFKLAILPSIANEFLFSNKTSTFQIKNIIKELSPKNSSRHDYITPKMLMEVSNIVLTVLSLLF